jgi:hypothetical protein
VRHEVGFMHANHCAVGIGELAARFGDQVVAVERQLDAACGQVG